MRWRCSSSSSRTYALLPTPKCALSTLLSAVLLAAGCGGHGRDSSGPAGTLKTFYAAADASDGEQACSLLTDSGIRQIVRVQARRACIETINGFAKGSFHSNEGDFVKVEHVEDEDDRAVKVEAEIKGRAGGTFTFARRGGRLLISGFKSDEG
jgi:hypothetical protein